MNFMDNLKKAVSDTASVAARKTSEFVEKSKTKYSIYDLKNEIEKIYTQLGEEVYKSYKSDESIADFVENKCAEIDALNSKIAELNKKLD